MGAHIPITQVTMIVRPDRESRLYDMIDHDNMYWFIYTARHDHYLQNVLPSAQAPTRHPHPKALGLPPGQGLRGKDLALSMGLHERLGQESLLLCLGPDLLALSESFL